MKAARNYLFINSLIALLVLAAYAALSVDRFQDEELRTAEQSLERSLLTMKELLRTRGDVFSVVDGRLLAGDYVINGNFEVPDKIQQIFGGAATIFMGDVRISTNILTEQGRRAIGTRLVGPPYEAIFQKGIPYRGEAVILGVPYLTAYDPIRDGSGRIIGALFVGVKKSELMAAFKELRFELYLVLTGLLLVLGTPVLFINRMARLSQEARERHITFLQTMIDTIPNPVFYKDAEGKFLGCNSAYEETFGWSRSALVGKTVFDVFPPEEAEAHYKMDRELFQSHSSQTYDATFLNRDGDRREIIVYKAAFPGETEKIGGIVGTLIDITDRQKTEARLREETLARLQDLEALREKDKLLMQQNRQAAMGEMINNIAHQWRQPLNTLGLIFQGMEITAESGGLTPEHVKNSVAKGVDIINHMSQTIEDFRMFFKPDKEKVTFKVGDAIAMTLKLIEASLKSQQIQVVLEETVETHIVGYPNEYSQVLLNILSNARDAFVEYATPPPRIVTITAQVAAGRSVVTVTDNAGGIPEEILGRIFDPYFTTKGPNRGTGIGLFMAKSIIEKSMNGSLSARNTGSGAEFRIQV